MPRETLLPRWTYDAVGPVCTTPNGAQDYDYYLRIARSFPMTFHGAVLAQWRVRADSMSGNTDERQFRWACQALGVLARERDEGPSESRDDVDASIRAKVRRASGLARLAVSDGRRPDPDDLDLLYRAVPRNPYVLATRALLALPPAVGREVTRGLEKSFTAVRRARR